MSLLTKVFGSANERAVQKLYPTVREISALAETMAAIDDLASKTEEFRARLAAGESLDNMVIEAFAVVREAAHRSIGLRPFDEQLLGGLVLHRGGIAEMRTGEGKTLVATLPCYLNALESKGVHVVTVNEYLAMRDSEWMGQVFAVLGMRAGCVRSGQNDSERQDAYNADITYGTNNEFGFDHLRDGLKINKESLVQRPFHFAIIDEVDSILIDEARTPLIISGPSDRAPDAYVQIDGLARQLEETHFELDEKHKQASLTDSGIEHLEVLAAESGLLVSGTLFDLGNVHIVHMAQTALRAHHLYQADAQYIVHPETKNVVIIDEFTGRMLAGRRFGDGLHQAIEAKHNLPIQQENQTIASITLQNLFRQYPKLAGMTGTAATEAAEFHEIYKLEVVEVPTHRKMVRIDEQDTIYRRGVQRDAAVIEEVRQAREKGQPVLVGTVTIEKSEELSSALRKSGIPHQVLNARHHEHEADIISEAGRKGAVTIATNMAGRGTDIKLGGTVEGRLKKRPNIPLEQLEAELQEEHDAVLAAGGLYIIGTERHESRRIDNQLRGRSGRQGDPGRSKFFLSLDDDLMRIFGSEKLDGMLAKLGLKENEPLVHSWISRAIEKAQLKVESQLFEMRKQLLKFDDVVNDQRKVIFGERRALLFEEDVAQDAADIVDDAIEDGIAGVIPDHANRAQWDDEALHSLLTTQLGLPEGEWKTTLGHAESEEHDDWDRESATAFVKQAYAARRELRMGDLDMKMENSLARTVMLQTLDTCWKEHLLNLDHLRQGIGLRAYGQRDPLNEFKEEAFGLFEHLLDDFRQRVVRTVSHVFVSRDTVSALDAEASRPRDGIQYGSAARALAKTAPAPSASNRLKPRTARNAACPCGSGKKYKHCHGTNSG